MNYYQNFCLRVPAHGEDLLKVYCAYSDPCSDDELREHARELRDRFEFPEPGIKVVQDRGDIYIEDEDGNPEWAITIALVQWWMKRNNIEQPLVIQYCNTASRSSPDVFGGGVVWIWPEDDYSIDTAELAALVDVDRLRKVVVNG